jgi:hypothetical protein
MRRISDMPDDIEERMKELYRRIYRNIGASPYIAPYPDFVEEELKCECGSDKAKLPTHSDWCPKKVNE